jgi:uncharacterized protein (TIGR03437 family)
MNVARIALLGSFPISALLGASSALDFTRFIQGPPAQTGTFLGTDKSGFLYAVGVTEAPANFPVTPGALSVPPGNWPMVFLQKLSPDGSQVLVSALLAETPLPSFPNEQNAAAVDSSGNVYVAFLLNGNIAGSPQWLGDPASPGSIAVLKIDSGGDKVLSATRIAEGYFGPVALALDSDGSVYVGIVPHVWKLDPTGNITPYSYTFTDVHPLGQSTYDGRSVQLAVLSDHSLYAMLSPSFLYRLDSTGTTILARADVGAGNVELQSLTIDGSGNAYVGGAATPGYSVASTQVGYSTIAQGISPALIAKFDPAGSLVYSDLFDVDTIEALTADVVGDVWAGGLSTSGFTLFELDASGARFVHYFSLVAPALTAYEAYNQLCELSLDNAGRLLAAGSTNALQFPGFSRWLDINDSVSDNPNQNAFFLRVSSDPPQTDLRLTVTATPSTSTIQGVIVYTAEIRNAGAIPANDVVLKLPESPDGDYSGYIACQASSQGECDQTTGGWAIYFPQIAAGASATVDLTYAIPDPTASPLLIPLTALSSTDDPNQLNNRGAPSVSIQPRFELNPDFPLGSESPRLEVDVAGVGEVVVSSTFNFVPVPVSSSARIYIPTPQFGGGTVYYEFASWGDGSTENPRTFPAGTASAAVVMRLVTEPWVDPDTGVANAASYRTGAVSPGEIVTLLGVNLGPAVLQNAQLDSQGRIATEVSGFQVLFGNSPAPIFYTSATQSAVIVPFEVAGRQTVQMTMHYQQTVSAPVPLTITSAAPGLFSANSSGIGLLGAYNQDNSLNTIANPASPGDLVVFFATGEGLTNPTPADGQIAGSNAPTPRLPVTVSIGGLPAEVLYSGGVPGSTAGLMRVKARIPKSALPGLLPVILSVGSYFSQGEATIAVR